MARIFISYARKDGAEAAHELTNRLHALRHEVFMDVHGIPGGVKWEEELIGRAAWCDVMLVLVTPASNASKYVYHEVREAEKNHKIIVPIRIGSVPLPDHLRAYNAFKLEEDNYDNILLKLENAMFPLVAQKQTHRRGQQLRIAGIVIVALLLVSVIPLVYFTIFAPRAAAPDPNTLIAFTASMNGNNDIWKMTADRSILTQLTANPADDRTADLSPDGTSIAFASDRDGDFEIYTMTVDGDNVRPITTNDRISDASPTWSPDGTRIAFVSNRERNDDIFIYDVATGAITNFTNHPDSDAAPAWSPDGTQIAFRSNRDNRSEIYVQSLDTPGARRITSSNADGYTIDWSPDGTRLAYESLINNTDYNVFVVDVASGRQQQLTTYPGNDAEPVWTADESSIIFVSERGGTRDLYWMSPTGRFQQNISFNVNNVFDPSVSRP